MTNANHQAIVGKTVATVAYDDHDDVLTITFTDGVAARFVVHGRDEPWVEIYATQPDIKDPS